MRGVSEGVYLLMLMCVGWVGGVGDLPEHLMLVRLDPVRSADPPTISGMIAARTFNTSSDLGVDDSDDGGSGVDGGVDGDG